MLLNKIPVLDKGYVALISSAVPHLVHKELLAEYFEARNSNALKKVCYATLVFKAPIFVQLYLAQNGLTLVSTKVEDVEAYEPNPGEICSGSHDSDVAIASDITRTTAALLINPSAYQSDGSDPFISQIIMPISTYTTFIVGANLEDWQKFYLNKSSPAPIRAYKFATEQIIKAEWHNV